MAAWEATLDGSRSEVPTAVSMELYIDTVKSAEGLGTNTDSADGGEGAL